MFLYMAEYVFFSRQEYDMTFFLDYSDALVEYEKIKEERHTEPGQNCWLKLYRTYLCDVEWNSSRIGYFNDFETGSNTEGMTKKIFFPYEKATLLKVCGDRTHDHFREKTNVAISSVDA